MSAQQYPSERARKLVENYEMVALALDTLGAGELHDAEDLVLNYIASVERERDELRAASSSSTPLSETPAELVIPATEDHPAIYRDGHRLTAKKPSLAPLSEPTSEGK